LKSQGYSTGLGRKRGFGLSIDPNPFGNLFEEIIFSK